MTVDGAPGDVLVVDHALLGVFVPAGARRVHFVHGIPGLRTSLIVAGLSVVVVLVLALGARRRVQAGPAEPSTV